MAVGYKEKTRPDKTNFIEQLKEDQHARREEITLFILLQPPMTKCESFPLCLFVSIFVPLSSFQSFVYT